MFPLSVILLVWSALLPAAREGTLQALWPVNIQAAAGPSRPAQPASYDPAARAVSNWQAEALRSLDPKLLGLGAVLLGVERPVISRCVKLNNYWCIKRARWTGEVGGDEEGHTGFASADNGADAAVALLRRYYVDFGRRSALDIVRRWAPVACGAGAGAFSGFTAALAVRGIAGTLRARYLASRRGAAPAGSHSRGRRAAAPRRPAISRVPLAPMPSFRVPDIAAGMGERRQATTAPGPRAPASTRGVARPAPVRVARPGAPTVPASSAKPVRVASATAPPLSGSSGCGEPVRIQNYAARMAEAAGVGAGADLKLFDREGRPLPSLGRVLLAMSAVELGLLHATTGLVESAVARAKAPFAREAAEPERADGLVVPAPDPSRPKDPP